MPAFLWATETGVQFRLPVSLYWFANNLLYVFLFYKQAALWAGAGTALETSLRDNTLRQRRLAQKLLLWLIYCNVAITFATGPFMAGGAVDEDGNCVPTWVWWMPPLAGIFDTVTSAVALFLFLLPFRGMMDSKTRQVAVLNFRAACFAIGTTFAFLLWSTIVVILPTLLPTVMQGHVFGLFLALDILSNTSAVCFAMGDFAVQNPSRVAPGTDLQHNIPEQHDVFVTAAQNIIRACTAYESAFSGNVVDEYGCTCVASWPGAYCQLWDRLVFESKAHERSAAVVFLPVEPWGCKWFELWRNHIKKAISKRQKLQVFFADGLVGKGKVASWAELKENAARRSEITKRRQQFFIHLPASERERLETFSDTQRDDSMGERPGSARQDEEERIFLASLDTEDREFVEMECGLGNSQRAEIAWLDSQGYKYEEMDVTSPFLFGRRAINNVMANLAGFEERIRADHQRVQGELGDMQTFQEQMRGELAATKQMMGKVLDQLASGIWWPRPYSVATFS